MPHSTGNIDLTPEQIEQRLDLWDGLTGGQATLINLSENHTFRIDCPDGTRHILRVHRPGYHSRTAIDSELAWLNALRADIDLPTITPIPGKNGDLLQNVGDDSEADTRLAVRFAFEQGVEPVEGENLQALFADLGHLAARCHNHVVAWEKPEFFTRPTWNTSTILTADGLWGNWRVAPHMTPDISRLLERANVQLIADFAAYGQTSENFGLIHADMRLANLLVHEGHTRLIDFDDCGFCWFAYDFAAAVSFFEDSPLVPQLFDIWCASYRQHRPFSVPDEKMVHAAILLRRFALLAWVGSHHETDLAKSHAQNFTTGTAGLAERYLTDGNIF